MSRLKLCFVLILLQLYGTQTSNASLVLYGVSYSPFKNEDTKMCGKTIENNPHIFKNCNKNIIYPRNATECECTDCPTYKLKLQCYEVPNMNIWVPINDMCEHIGCGTCTGSELSNLTAGADDRTGYLNEKRNIRCRDNCLDISVQCTDSENNGWKITPVYGQLTCTDNEFTYDDTKNHMTVQFNNGVYKYTCHDQYKKTDRYQRSEERTCTNGQLNGILPTCKCDDCETIKNYFGKTTIFILLVIMTILFLIFFIFWCNKTNKLKCFKRDDSYISSVDTHIPVPDNSVSNMNNPVKSTNDVKSRNQPQLNNARLSNKDSAYLDVLGAYKYDYVDCKDLRKSVTSKPGPSNVNALELPDKIGVPVNPEIAEYAVPAEPYENTMDFVVKKDEVPLTNQTGDENHYELINENTTAVVPLPQRNK